MTEFCPKHIRETHSCSSIPNDEIAGVHPDMNIKVAAYIKV